MVTPELGTKRACPKCARKFYDLNKNPATCPGCKHNFDPEAVVKKRTKKRGKAEAVEKSLANSAASGAEQEEDIDMPEFEDLSIMEDLEELDDMDVEVDVGKKSSPHTNDEPDEDEAFLDEDDILQGADEDELSDDDLLDDEDSEDDSDR